MANSNPPSSSPPTTSTDNELDEIIKKYGSGVVDNCMKLVDNPDYKFEKNHDKLHAEALAAIHQWSAKRERALLERLISQADHYGDTTIPETAVPITLLQQELEKLK